jgi:beta-N-acetylhexosaminidase
MTLRDKVAQLVFVPFYGEAPNTRSLEYQKYLRWVRSLRVGGLVLVNRVRNGAVEHAEPFAMTTFVNRMQRAARVPLLVAGDFERGDSMRVASETKFPHAMAFAATRDPSLSRYEGAVTARQARVLGVPWILAPVADVNINPENPILNIRSYSEDPAEVSAHVRAFIEGAHSGTPDPVLVTAKHFPGHGDTDTDTHLAMALLHASKERIEALELVPFRAAIAAGADAVMSAHIAVPALDDPATPATLSRPILTGVLREELGFQGLIVTDALDMLGIAQQWNSGQAAVKALEAGADVLLMPANPEQAVDAVVHAVLNGTLRRQRIDESLARLLAAKVHVGLNRRRFVDPEAAMDELDSPDDLVRVQEIADRSVTLVKNQDSLVPLKDRTACFLVLPEGRYSNEGKVFAAEVRKRSPNAEILTLDPAANDAEFEKAAAAAGHCDAVVVAAFASLAVYHGGTALPGGYPQLLNALLDAGRPMVLLALGNPYLIRAFPDTGIYLTTYSTVPPCEIAAVKALYGEIPIHGRLPVTIPSIAKYGDGIQLGH